MVTDKALQHQARQAHKLFWAQDLKPRDIIPFQQVGTMRLKLPVIDGLPGSMSKLWHNDSGRHSRRSIGSMTIPGSTSR